MTTKTAFIVQCGECKHEWPAFYVPCNLTRLAELLKNAKCPMCMTDAYNVFCDTAPVDEINTSSKRVKKTGET
jgi:hypothetical protein